ncbi:MAG: shikimate kinase [Bacteroidales bacterium]|jgi:shikimate kinase|nr:shikimate kinase [Bacteroidales bacterium]
MNNRIYLVGYMGAGKSTCAKRLSNKLNWDFKDLDQLFESKYKIAITNFFEKYDESLFRRLERDLLQETHSLQNTIIATGGGTACFYNNMSWMNENGHTVYLQMSPSALTNRLIHAKKKRPLIAKKNPEELYLYVKDQLRQRAIFYSQAKIIIDAENLNLDLLVLKLKKELPDSKI